MENKRTKQGRTSLKYSTKYDSRSEIKTKLTSRFSRRHFDLTSVTHRPFKKKNDQLLYINTSSNHPPSIMKQIPASINKRLSDNSSNESIFNTAKPEYEAALQNSRYSALLSFSPCKPTKRKRKRNILWFNPPYNKSVQTNIGRIFLNLINKHFPNSGKLHKIFNKNTLKLSYSCM